MKFREPIEGAGKTSEGLRIDRIVDPTTAALTSDQPGLTQHLQMMGQQRGRDLDGLCKYTGGTCVAAQLTNDRPPYGITKRPELFNSSCVHDCIVRPNDRIP
jgi:hypothetical protein